MKIANWILPNDKYHVGKTCEWGCCQRLEYFRDTVDFLRRCPMSAEARSLVRDFHEELEK